MAHQETDVLGSIHIQGITGQSETKSDVAAVRLPGIKDDARIGILVSRRGRVLGRDKLGDCL
jgi:hypothetical protein